MKKVFLSFVIAGALLGLNSTNANAASVSKAVSQEAPALSSSKSSVKGVTSAEVTQIIDVPGDADHVHLIFKDSDGNTYQTQDPIQRDLVSVGDSGDVNPGDDSPEPSYFLWVPFIIIVVVIVLISRG